MFLVRRISVLLAVEARLEELPGGVKLATLGEHGLLSFLEVSQALVIAAAGEGTHEIPEGAIERTKNYEKIMRKL